MNKEHTEIRTCDDCGYDYAVNSIYPDMGVCQDCDEEFENKMMSK